MSDSVTVPVSTALPPRARASLAKRVFLLNPTGVISSAVLLLLILGACFAPWLSAHDPFTTSFERIFAPPGGDLLLGGDSAGRDVWARLLHGARFSLAGAAVAIVVAATIGILFGLVAGYYGGWFDAVTSWINGLIMALPGVIVLIAAIAVIGPTMWATMAILGVLMAPAFYRLVYVSVRGVRGELYVDAARVAGLTDARIIGRHIFAMVRGPALLQGAMMGALAITIQSGLEFLGLGDADIPTWGMMLNDAFTNMYTAPSLLIWPSLAITITSVALTLLANVVRDELERTGTSARRRRREAAARAAEPDPDPDPVIVHESTPNPKTTSPLLVIGGLSVAYDQPEAAPVEVVSSVSLSVERGQIHGLIGESGSGKTQTAWSILGLLPPGGRISAGSITFDGVELTCARQPELDQIRGKRIGYIPQEPMSNLDPSFRIGSQLVEPMQVRAGMSKRAATAHALELLARVGIPDPRRTFDAYPHQVSGGMAQRILIAGAIACSPDLLIADEPTTALDVTVQAEVLDLLRGLQQELGMGMILVTHNFGVVADLCDYVSVMRHGRIVETGPVRALFADPRHPYTKALFNAILQPTLDTDARATGEAEA
ncbi:dipeptide/oligopeptide/nickel ABC transporter permease/ATP-binding protein [Nonomuraea sp. NPDC050328]|uniref:dipeptide/oligopeptide/nickel ABC transporter permease/ATP-binding protein n=1 Tax=Nonomuraea sp. NPDC050328 TaxID=3364361 RepID=UPI00378E44E1